MKKYIIFFLVFIAIRIILWQIFGTNLDPNWIIDGREYYANGLNLNVEFKTPWVYSNWYERTPLYMLFIYIIRGNLIFQIIVCGIAGTLAFKINKFLGLFYLFYPNWIFQSFNFSKEALLIALTLIALYFLKDHLVYLFICTIAINIGFLSFSQNILEYNLNHSFKFMQALYEIWKPSPDLYLVGAIGNILSLTVYFPFWLTILYYFRRINKFDISLIFALGVTIFFSFGWACMRYREIVLPFMIYYLVKEGYIDMITCNLKHYVCKWIQEHFYLFSNSILLYFKIKE